MWTGLCLTGIEESAKINYRRKLLPQSAAAAGHSLRFFVRERLGQGNALRCMFVHTAVFFLALFYLVVVPSLRAQTVIAPTLAARVTATTATPGTFSTLVATAGSTIVTPINQQPVFRIQPPTVVRLLLLGVLALLLFFVAILLSTPDSMWLVETKRRRAMWLALAGSYVLLPILLVLTASGCSGGSSASTTPPPTTQSTPAGTYTLTVLATANGKCQSKSLTLIVQ